MKLLGDELAALKFDANAFLARARPDRIVPARDRPARGDPAHSRRGSPPSWPSSRLDRSPWKPPRNGPKDDLRAVKAWHRTESALIPLAAEQDKALAKHAEVMKKKDDAQKAAGAAQAGVVARRETAKALAEAAGKAQDVVKKLPKEKDLADAARIFANRSAAAAAELAASEKASGEKAVALKKAGEELDAASPGPSRRPGPGPSRSASRFGRRRRSSWSPDGRWPRAASPLRGPSEVAAVARSLRPLQVAAREARGQSQRIARPAGSRSPSAKTRSARSGGRSCKTRQEAVEAAESARIAAEKARADAQSAVERHRKARASVDAALVATRAARSACRADTTLSEAAEKLKAQVRRAPIGSPN